MKKIILFIFFFSFFIPAFADTKCAYTSELNQCKAANKNWTTRSITDFICISSKKDYQILSQIILDKEFKKIDKKVEAEIATLEKNKDYYFWSKAKKDYISWIDDVESMYWPNGKYWKQYLSLCVPANKNSIFSQTLSCIWDSTTAEESKNYLDYWTCKQLALTKLEIYKQVSIDIFKINKAKVLSDSTTLVSQDQRGKYDNIVDLFMYNLWYLERIWKKWTSKTKDAN